MPEGRGQDVEAIFAAALERGSPAERAAYLDGACARDTGLRRRVEALLGAHGEASGGSFMGAPVTAESFPSGGRRPALAEMFADNGEIREGPGTRIGTYKILQLIGEGGFGSVFMADQEAPVRRRVAVKIIKMGMDTRRVIARFEAERQALAMMDHPNIARVLDAGATGTGRPYFVMELVKGEPIATYADKNSLTIAERLVLFTQVCQAVQHAHTKGIIHRDIKPSNVLVATQDGRPFAKIIDFGIAKATDRRLTEKTLFTEHKALIGTPEYMSPEQAEGSLDIDTRTDVYSLGVLLYELLTGTTPFDSTALRSASYVEIQRIIREVEPQRPSTRLSRDPTLSSVAASRRSEPRALGTLVRGDMDWIVMKALEKDRSRRYDTASALAQDIQRHLAGEPVTAAPPSTAYRLRKFVRRNRGPVIACSLLVLTLAGGVVGTTAGMVMAVRERNAKEAARAAEAEQRAAAEASAKKEAEQRAAAEASSERAANEAARADQAASRAQRKAAAAASARDLLRDTLASADRGQRQGKADVTVREVMDEIAASMDAGTSSYEPEVEASVRDIVGVTYRSLGQYEEAERHLRRALEVQIALHGQEHLDVAQARNNLALVLHDTGRSAEAAAMLRQNLEVETRLVGTEHDLTADTQDNLSVVLAALGRAEEAEGLCRAALETRRRLFPPDHPEIATSMNHLALLLSDRGEEAEAESLLRGALEIVRARYGEENPKVSIALSNLASVVRERGGLAEAASMLREALAMRRRLLGPGHAELSGVLNNLARVEADLGDLGGAIGHQTEALEIARRAHGPTHTAVATILNNLAIMQRQSGDASGAEASLRESAEIVRRLVGPEHTDYAIVLNNTADLIEWAGDNPRALAMFEESLAILRRGVSGAHPLLIGALTRTAQSRARAGDTLGADALLVEAVGLARRLPEESPDRANTLINVVQTRLEMGQPEVAEPLAREAMLLRDRAYADDHPLAWRKYNARSMYGGILMDKAARMLAAGATREGGSESAQSGAPVTLLREAEGLIVPAYQAVKDDPRVPGVAPGTGPNRKREMLERVVRLFETWDLARPGEGYAGMAAPWRRALEAMPK